MALRSPIDAPELSISLGSALQEPPMFSKSMASSSLSQAKPMAPPQASSTPISKPTQPKLTLKELISFQRTSGEWDEQSLDKLASFFGGSCEDAAVFTEIEAQISAKSKLQAAFTTLIALFILQEAFEDDQDKWQMIAKKAIDFLKSVNIQKPQQLVNKLSLEIQN